MISEDYVSFETAKLLKEKGFDEECYLHYSSNGKTQHWNYQSPTDGIAAPTLQMAMKWLRKVHNIDIWVEGYNKRYKGNIHSEQRGNEALFYEDTYEEACEAAIRYCLENLI